MRLHSRFALVFTLIASTVVAQTRVTPPKNKYTPEQDVQIGKEAAAEVRQQYPLITDDHPRPEYFLLRRLFGLDTGSGPG